MTHRRTIVVVLLLALAGVAAVAAGTDEAGRPLLDVEGTVTEVALAGGADGARWLDAAVATATRGTLRLRLAPPDVLARDGFALRPGDRVRARVFADEEPHGVHRIANETTGRALRLRCLHGDPLWSARPGGRGGGRRRGR